MNSWNLFTNHENSCIITHVIIPQPFRLRRLPFYFSGKRGKILEKQKKRFAVPHVYILLLTLILIFSLLSYVVPSNVYDYHEITIEETGATRNVIDPTTYHAVDKTLVSLMQFLTAVPRGMQESAQIIFFIFIVGGAMTVLQETRAIEAGLGRLIKGLKDKSIPFIPIFVSLMVASGFDSLTGVAVVLAGAGSGFVGASMNPFTIQVAQGIAELPLLSGIGFRVVMYICFVAVTIAMVMHYALKVKKNPQLSPMYDFDKTRDDVADLDSLPPFGGREKAILVVFLIAIVMLIWGVIKKGWYMDEIAALFLGMSMIVAAIGGLGFNNYALTLGRGMVEIASGALVVGFARGILVVMTDGNILHTILHGAASLLEGLPAMISAVGMYIFQCLLNFLVPSGSGQAAVSMPIMAPLADLVGVSRQTACIAYQLGDGISNVFTPTSGYFMAGLALAKVPWSKWAKWFLLIIGLQYLLGAIFVIAAQVTGLQ